MQFGFMKGKGTTDAIFMARQMQDNFRVKGTTTTVHSWSYDSNECHISDGNVLCSVLLFMLDCINCIVIS